jgi:phosphodiesterase/alkaline phosphatase D-like protein
MAPIDSPGSRPGAGVHLVSRRAALRMAGAAALTLPASPLLATPLPNNIIGVFSSSARELDWREEPFTLGVASGAPRPDGFVLWTRLAPDALSANPTGGIRDGDREICYEIADEPSFRRIVQRGPAFRIRLRAFRPP